MQSKIKNFRFSEAMCNDLDRLAAIWSCTATEAVSRALAQAVIIEDWKAYQVEQKPAQQPEQPVLEDDSLLNLKESAQQDTTIIEKEISVPEQPKEKIVRPAAAENAKDKPRRLQVRIFIRGEKKPCKTFSGYDRAELDQRANQWLRENSYQTYTVSDGTSYRWEV